MRVQIEANLPLDDAIDQQTDHRQHGQGRNPLRLLEPHGSDSRGILDPTKPRFYSGILVLIGLENIGIATHLSVASRGQHHPAIDLVWVGERLHVHDQAIAYLQRGRVALGGTPPVLRKNSIRITMVDSALPPCDNRQSLSQKGT